MGVLLQPQLLLGDTTVAVPSTPGLQTIQGVSSATWNAIGVASIAGNVGTLPNSASRNSAIYTNRKYAFAGSSVYAQATMAIGTPGVNDINFGVTDTVNSNYGSWNNAAVWFWEGAGTTANPYYLLNGSQTSLTATGALASPQYFRIRQSTGTVYWDYSSDGVSWTNQASATIALPSTMYLAATADSYASAPAANLTITSVNGH